MEREEKAKIWKEFGEKIEPLLTARATQKAAAGGDVSGYTGRLGRRPAAGMPIPKEADGQGLLVSNIANNFALTAQYRQSKRFRRYVKKAEEAIEFIAVSYIPPIFPEAASDSLWDLAGMSLAFIAMRQLLRHAKEDGDAGGMFSGVSRQLDDFMGVFDGAQFYESVISSAAGLYGEGGVVAVFQAAYDRNGERMKELSDVAVEEAAAQFLFERAFCNSAIAEDTACRLAVPETLSEKMECFLLYMRSLIGSLIGEAAKSDVSQCVADSLREAREEAEKAEDAEERVKKAQEGEKKAEKENARLRARLDEAKEKARTAKVEALAELQGEITERDREIARLRRRIGALEEKRGRAEEPDGEAPEGDGFPEGDMPPAADADISRILFVIGLKGEARARIEAAFPGCRVERPEKASDELVRGSSLVIYNTEFAKHGQYWRVRNVAAAAGVPFLHTTAHNVDKLAELVRGHVTEELWNEYMTRRENP